MTVAEKLTTIAENQQKVYDAGYAAGQEAGGGGGGEEPVIEGLTVTENGTYTAPDGVDGYSPVTVEVPSVGEADILKYVSANGVLQGLFRQADFGGKDEIRIDIPNAASALSELFGRALGVRKITLIVPTTKTYNGYRLIYGHSSGTSDLEELALPDGIGFNNFQGFAQNDVMLETISFVNLVGEKPKGIDLSSSTTNASCFANCPKLKNINFTPNGITLSISFAQSSNLSDASIASIIDGLATVTDQQILTLHSTVVNKLTTEQLTSITDKNWITG